MELNALQLGAKPLQLNELQLNAANPKGNAQKCVTVMPEKNMYIPMLSKVRLLSVLLWSYDSEDDR